jgi:hypothetical protein
VHLLRPPRSVPWPLGLILVAFTPLALAAGPEAEEAVSVRLRPYVGRLLSVPIVVEQRNLTFLLDTGGGQTLITPGLAATLGCIPHGRAVGFRMNGDRVEFKYCDRARLEIGGRAVERSPIAVWDVMSILPKDFPPLDGVLALDALADRAFSLDLANATLTLESTASLARRLPGTRKLTARVANGLSGAERTLFLRGALDEPGWFLFDSGNLDLVQATPHMLRATGPLPREVDAALLNIDGLPPAKSSLRVRDILYDGALSESFLRAWVWTFRLATGEVWAAPASGSP